MWRFRTASPWRDLPVEHGPRSTTCDRFRAWARAGVSQDLAAAVRVRAAM
ncbi:transposase [Herbidospora galbida]